MDMLCQHDHSVYKLKFLIHWIWLQVYVCSTLNFFIILKKIFLGTHGATYTYIYCLFHCSSVPCSEKIIIGSSELVFKVLDAEQHSLWYRGYIYKVFIISRLL